LRVAGAVAYFWWLRGYVGEGRRWLSGVLAATPRDEGFAARAKACHAAGILALAADECPAAQAFHEDALTIQRQLSDRIGISRTLTNLGNIAVAQDDFRTARARFEEALTMSRDLDDRRGVAINLANLGTLANDLGDHASARAFLEESLTIGREVGGWIVAYALSYLGKLAHDQGDRQVPRPCWKRRLRSPARRAAGWRHARR
jgi:tetratricopeptide (TPR) repeat protein